MDPDPNSMYLDPQHVVFELELEKMLKKYTSVKKSIAFVLINAFF